MRTYGLHCPIARTAEVLATRLERTGVVYRTPLSSGRGSLYGLTPAGDALRPLMLALGWWGERGWAHIEGIRPPADEGELAAPADR